MSVDAEGQKRTILIAEDEDVVRVMARTSIESSDYDIIEAADGGTAWRLAQKHKPALILLDVRMPVLSGLDVCRLVRGDATLAQTRIILMSASAHPSEIAEGIAEGADQYLTKPFSPIALLEMVRELLRRPGDGS